MLFWIWSSLCIGYVMMTDEGKGQRAQALYRTDRSVLLYGTLLIYVFIIEVSLFKHIPLVLVFNYSRHCKGTKIRQWR